jgi:hypothetical protein
MFMKLPTSIRLTDGGAFLDGGTLTFDAVNNFGESVKIRLNQHKLGGTDDPGRLFYNGNMVDVRSKLEEALLSLLQAAEIQVDAVQWSDTDLNYIGLPTEKHKALIELKTECIDEFRHLLIDFVRSERYIEVSKHGL